MARSSECTGGYAKKVLDTADIVRDACFRQSESEKDLPEQGEPLYNSRSFGPNAVNGVSASTICRRKYATCSGLDFLTGCCLFVGGCQRSTLPGRFFAPFRATLSSFFLFKVQ